MRTLELRLRHWFATIHFNGRTNWHPPSLSSDPLPMCKPIPLPARCSSSRLVLQTAAFFPSFFLPFHSLSPTADVPLQPAASSRRNSSLTFIICSLPWASSLPPTSKMIITVHVRRANTPFELFFPSSNKRILKSFVLWARKFCTYIVSIYIA